LLPYRNDINHALGSSIYFAVSLADSHNILNGWKNYFSQLLNVHRVRDVKQTEINTAEPLVPDPSPFQFEIAIAKLKRHKSPGSDQIPAELI
jgi:hypothetical protein